MTTVYSYSAHTGCYLSSKEASVDPIEGKPLVPAHSTTLAPPKTSKDEAAIYFDGRWKVVPDYRGTVYWLADGSMHTINKLEVIPPGDALHKKPKLPPNEETISLHIYAQYPPNKQTQDAVNAIDFPTRLKASGIEGLEKTVVDVITAVHFGKRLDELVASFVQNWMAAFYTPPTLPEGVKPLTNKQLQVHKKQAMADWSWQLAKLVKIGLRTNWKDACVRAGKAAIVEGREPEFPPFPKI